MKTDKNLLTTQQYNALYCKAFAKLDEICLMAEQSMRELEELQLFMGESETEE